MQGRMNKKTKAAKPLYKRKIPTVTFQPVTGRLLS
jgi:hypothetical protein